MGTTKRESKLVVGSHAKSGSKDFQCGEYSFLVLAKPPPHPMRRLINSDSCALRNRGPVERPLDRVGGGAAYGRNSCRDVREDVVRAQGAPGAA